MSGRVLQTLEGSTSDGVNYLELNLAEEKAGIYIAVLKENGNAHQVRIVKQ